jgi:hypothetical protein
MPTLTDRFAQSVGHHFVTLSCVQHPHDAGEMRIHVLSGFIVEILGEWFYMTAGHILRRIRQAIDAGSTFDVWRFGDQTAGNRFNNMAVPYFFESEKWFVLEDSDAGLDYATVHIGGLYRKQLEAGGVSAIEKSAWSDYTAEHDHWALVGIPSETVVYDGKTEIAARVVVAPLVPADAPPGGDTKASNQFYAKLAEDSGSFVTNVDGMSGGPIFMLKFVHDTWRYSVIGVQSAWYPSQRLIVGCPFATFGNALEPVVEEALLLAQNQKLGLQPGAA